MTTATTTTTTAAAARERPWALAGLRLLGTVRRYLHRRPKRAPIERIGIRLRRYDAAFSRGNRDVRHASRD